MDREGDSKDSMPLPMVREGTERQSSTTAAKDINLATQRKLVSPSGKSIVVSPLPPLREAQSVSLGSSTSSTPLIIPLSSSPPIITPSSCPPTPSPSPLSLSSSNATATSSLSSSSNRVEDPPVSSRNTPLKFEVTLLGSPSHASSLLNRYREHFNGHIFESGVMFTVCTCKIGSATFNIRCLKDPAREDREAAVLESSNGIVLLVSYSTPIAATTAQMSRVKKLVAESGKTTKTALIAIGCLDSAATPQGLHRLRD